jgi:general stress protein YciG
VAKEDRGFASMDRAKQREIASKGGKAAHQKGTAHEWTSEEARDAGRKGGIASHRRRREMQQGGTTTSDDTNTEGGAQNREGSSNMNREDRMSDFAGNDREGSER